MSSRWLYGTWPSPGYVVRYAVMPTLCASSTELTAHWYGTRLSAVPWKSRNGASPALIAAPRSLAPDRDPAPPTAEEKPGLPLVPGSSLFAATWSGVIAPAEDPPIAMRV